MRPSTRTSITVLLFVLPFAFLGMFCVSSWDRFVLWRYGETGIVLPIDKYESRKAPGERRRWWHRSTVIQVADVSVRLDAGSVLVIPETTVTMELIQASRQGKVGIVVLPGKPRVHHIEGYSRGLLMEWLMTSIVTAMSFIWFRFFRHAD